MNRASLPTVFGLLALVAACGAPESSDGSHDPGPPDGGHDPIQADSGKADSNQTGAKSVRRRWTREEVDDSCDGTVETTGCRVDIFNHEANTSSHSADDDCDDVPDDACLLFTYDERHNDINTMNDADCDGWPESESNPRWCMVNSYPASGQLACNLSEDDDCNGNIDGTCTRIYDNGRTRVFIDDFGCDGLPDQCDVYSEDPPVKPFHFCECQVVKKDDQGRQIFFAQDLDCDGVADDHCVTTEYGEQGDELTKVFSHCPNNAPDGSPTRCERTTHTWTELEPGTYDPANERSGFGQGCTPPNSDAIDWDPLWSSFGDPTVNICSGLPSDLKPEDVPCIEGYVVLAGQVDGMSICEAFERHGFSASGNKWSSRFGADGRYYASSFTGPSRGETAPINNGLIEMPVGSVMQGRAFEFGEGSVYRAPGFYEKDYRLVVESLEEAGTTIEGQLGICTELSFD